MHLISTKEAATLLGIKPGTLKAWRTKGKGPKFIKGGYARQAGVGYELADIEAWKAEHKFASTSAVTVQARPTVIRASCPPGRTSA